MLTLRLLPAALFWLLGWASLSGFVCTCLQESLALASRMLLLLGENDPNLSGGLLTFFQFGFLFFSFFMGLACNPRSYSCRQALHTRLHPAMFYLFLFKLSFEEFCFALF